MMSCSTSQSIACVERWHLILASSHRCSAVKRVVGNECLHVLVFDIEPRGRLFIGRPQTGTAETRPPGGGRGPRSGTRNAASARRRASMVTSGACLCGSNSSLRSALIVLVVLFGHGQLLERHKCLQPIGSAHPIGARRRATRLASSQFISHRGRCTRYAAVSVSPKLARGTTQSGVLTAILLGVTRSAAEVSRRRGLQRWHAVSRNTGR